MKEKLLSEPSLRRQLAGFMNLTVGAVNQWASGRRPWPADRCIQVEKFTSGDIRCEDLRPDVDWAYLRGTDKQAT